MDGQLHSTMQDLAEAWVAVNTETNFRRSLQIASNRKTSLSSIPDTDDDSVSPTDPPPTSCEPSNGIAADAVGATPFLPSRKRKQSSPQPCRDQKEAADGSPPSKVLAKDQQEPADSKNGKMLPVHCSIETVESGKGLSEGYAIVPSTLLLNELVGVALGKLDYTKEHILNATGVIQVQNWKCLPFSAISDDPQATVGKILGDLLSYVTLKIKIAAYSSAGIPSSPTPKCSSVVTANLCNQPSLLGFPIKRSTDSVLVGSKISQEIRLKILQLLEKRGPTMMVCHGCPFSQATVLAILQGKYTKPIQQEKLQSFYQWYTIYNGLMDNTLVAPEKLDTVQPVVKTSSRHWRRPRTLFDQRYELPRLISWYRSNPRPSRSELEIYLAELNSTERRSNVPPLQYSSIAIWFKNARAKYRGLRCLSPDTPERTTRIKSQLSRLAEMTERRRELNLNGTQQMHIPSAKFRPDTKMRFTFPSQMEASNGTEPRLTNGLNFSYQPNMSARPDLTLLRIPVKQNENSVIEQRPAVTLPSRVPGIPCQVTDICKIASGFGIKLSPAVKEDTCKLATKSVKVESLVPAARIVGGPTQHESALNLSNSKAIALISSCNNNNNTPMTAVPMPNTAPIRIPTTSVLIRHNNHINNHVNGPTRMPVKPSSPLGTQPHRSPGTLSIPQQMSANRSPGNRSSRKRFNIHPSLEVPKLQSWFCVNPKPDRHAIDQFVDELNRSEFRKTQQKYDSRIVYVWFKNARAKYSRRKVREGDESRADMSNLTLTYSRVIQL